MDVAAPHDLSDVISGRPLPASSMPTVRRDEAHIDPVGGGFLPAMPDVGDSFEGFEIVAELGRGSFGRVYLARQIEMAYRLVALKVTSEFFDETRTLAQLQHTNIVPIYSTHGEGRSRGLCMPYFGATTLADVCLGIRSTEQLPTSGKHFFSTVVARRVSTDADHVLFHHDPTSDSVETGQPWRWRAGNVIAAAQPTFELLNRFTFVEAVLWIGTRLADGLTHAHERGIVHRDIKPANVLLADDGRPMLLDFNLSADANSQTAARGGTLPYMSPEQLRAQIDRTHTDIDGRADVYALGLVLYELLAGKMAYPRHRGQKADVVRPMLQEREVAPPALTSVNPAVTPATEAIIRKCLAFHPGDRYASAAELRVDLERQLANRPLRYAAEPSLRERALKWRRRHPSATSLSTLSVLAGLVVVAMALGLAQYRQTIQAQHAAIMQQTAEAELQSWLAATDQLRHDIIRTPSGDLRTNAIVAARDALAKYGVLKDQNWQGGELVAPLGVADSQRLKARVGELLAHVTQSQLDQVDSRQTTAAAADLLAFSDAAATLFDAGQQPYYWWRQRERVCQALGDARGAEAAAAKLVDLKPETPTDRYLQAVEYYLAGKYADGVSVLNDLTRKEPQHFEAWYVLGSCQYRLNRDDDAATSFTSCIALNPKSHAAYFNRGLAQFRARHDAALLDFQTAQDLGDADPALDLQIAKCLIAVKQLDQAERICDSLIGADSLRLRALVVRSDIHRRRNNLEGALADRAEALRATPVTAADFIARGAARMAARDVDGAFTDFRRAEDLNPTSDSAQINQSHILSDRLKEPKNDEAIAALDRLLERSPDSPNALAGRAVLLARVGRFEDALRDARHCVKISHQPFVRYQLAGVYALTVDRPGHLKEALRLLAGAIHDQPELADELENDPELKAIRSTPEFKRLAEAAKTLRSMD